MLRFAQRDRGWVSGDPGVQAKVYDTVSQVRAALISYVNYYNQERIDSAGAGERRTRLQRRMRASLPLKCVLLLQGRYGIITTNVVSESSGAIQLGLEG